jgi:hypothetical protein
LQRSTFGKHLVDVSGHGLRTMRSGFKPTMTCLTTQSGTGERPW